MFLYRVYNGLKKYLKGYYAYGKAIDEMNPYSFVLDGIWCLMRYGCVFNQFTEGGFYKYRAYQRKKILTYRNWKKLIKVNAPADIHYFKNKVDFNTFYKKFVGRDWLDSATMTEADFRQFADKHGKAIVKPIDDWEGNGISMVKLTPPNAISRICTMTLKKSTY